MRAYKALRPSGVSWVGAIPAHWEMQRVRFRCRLNPRIRPDLDDEQDVSFLPMEAIGDDGSITIDATRKVKEVASGYTCFEDGDVTIAKITPCFENGKGAVMKGLLGGIGFGTTELIVIRPESATDSNWLYYLTQSEPFRNIGEAMMYGAGGQKRVPDSYVKDLPVAWPPRHEQQAIAAYLDIEAARIDALISEKERLIETLVEYRQATISEVITKGLDPSVPMKKTGVFWLGDVPEHWNVQAIKRLSPVKRGASPRPIADPIYFDDQGEYCWVRIEDVTRSSGVLLESEQRLSDLGSSLSVKLEPGSLFLSIAGSVGKACITGTKACIHDGFVYFPHLSINPRFLFCIFESGLAFQGLGKMGTQLNLNTQTVGDIQIAIPPESEINEMLNYLDGRLSQADLLLTHVNCEIGLLRELRSTTITDAVLGRIRVC